MQVRVSRVLGARRFQYVLGLIVMGVLLSVPARATITLTSDPNALAQAMEQTAGTITGASFVALPPNGTPHGIEDAALDGFPTDGSTFTILTNGNAGLADQPNNAGDSGADDGGGNVRGGTNWDVSILKIDLNVPPLANCLSFDFRFLSDEYPEWVGSDFNDAFIAELDSSTWTTNGSNITAPNNFAFDPSHNVISINGAGATSMTVGNAVGTTYDGATPVLGASTPITAGAHSLYLSIFDMSDRDVDSAVFLDRLILSTTAPGDCQAGATVLSVSKTVNPSIVHPADTVHYTVNVHNPSASPVTVSQITDILPSGFVYVPGSTTGVTTADPGIGGQTLTWSGSFAVPASSAITLHFDAIAPVALGDYFNNASATADSPVTPSGPTAKVSVVPVPVPCGNGTLDSGEQCDDGGICVGSSNPGAACLTGDANSPCPASGQCRSGNGGLECYGGANDGMSCMTDGGCPGGTCQPLSGATCDPNCTFPACGNGIVDPGEQCDDGNQVNGDGCDNNCTTTACGNGIVTGGEQCDDGNQFDGDGCSSTCMIEHFCGNGIVEPGETCDPPGTPMPPNGNPCRLDCTYCGDGIVNGVPGSETCDDGNSNNNDSCGNFCIGSQSGGIDHFECYRSRVIEEQTLIPPPRPPWGPALTMVNPFTTLMRNVVRPLSICNPTSVDGSDPGAPSHTDHLVGYQLHERRPYMGHLPIRTQRVVNEFGTMFFDLKWQLRMIVPSAKQTNAQPPPLGQTNLDHFTCYKVVPSKGAPHFTQRMTTLSDQFGTATVKILRPTKLCLPTDVNNSDPGSENDLPQLMCYRVQKPIMGIGQVFINNEFGPGRLFPLYRDELCVPSLRNP